MRRFIYLFITFSLTALISCHETRSFYLKNSSKNKIEIIYDDRIYRSQMDSIRTYSKKALERDSSFFIGLDSSISNIWPDFLQINSESDTIILKGRRAIRSMINGKENEKFLIVIR